MNIYYKTVSLNGGIDTSLAVGVISDQSLPLRIKSAVHVAET